MFLISTAMRVQMYPVGFIVTAFSRMREVSFRTNIYRLEFAPQGNGLAPLPPKWGKSDHQMRSGIPQPCAEMFFLV
jgi:hypothetical protein